MGWQDAPEVAAPAWASAPEVGAPTKNVGLRGEGYDRAMNYSGKDAVGGSLRGAASIGTTLWYPVDTVVDAVKGDRGPSLTGLISGKQPLTRNQERRANLDQSISEFTGADPNSTAYKTAKLGTEIAGTAGVGGMLAKGAQSVPVIAQNAPLLINALKSGGMSLGGSTGSSLVNTLLRMTGGSVTGAASAGLIDPKDAKTGAVVGAVAPPVIQAAGAAGKYLGEKAATKYQAALDKFNRNAPLRETVKDSVDAGYVIPPNMVNPSAKNALIESFSGKQATSQIASVKNQDVTEKLVRQSLGIAPDAPLTKGALEQIRKIEGGAYKKVADLSPQAAADLEALKQARNEAQGWFNAYNRSASPADLAKAKEFRATADNLENWLEYHAVSAGKEDLIPALKEARKQIAKTYTVERSLNDAGGSVNAKVLGRLYEKGAPLSDGLDVAGRFASRFPSIAQAPQNMGSPAAHNLRAMASMLLGGGGLAAAGPAGIAAGAAPFIVPPVARSVMFSKGAQQALAQGSAPQMASANKLAELLQNPEVQQFLARSAPAIAAQSR